MALSFSMSIFENVLFLSNTKTKTDPTGEKISCTAEGGTGKPTEKE
jgi:hypothetical protein